MTDAREHSDNSEFLCRSPWCVAPLGILQSPVAVSQTLAHSVPRHCCESLRAAEPLGTTECRKHWISRRRHRPTNASMRALSACKSMLSWASQLLVPTSRPLAENTQQCTAFESCPLQRRGRCIRARIEKTHSATLGSQKSDRHLGVKIRETSQRPKPVGLVGCLQEKHTPSVTQSLQPECFETLPADGVPNVNLNQSIPPGPAISSVANCSGRAHGHAVGRSGREGHLPEGRGGYTVCEGRGFLARGPAPD